MSAPEGTLGHGTLLYRSTDGVTWGTAIAQILDISTPKGVADDVEVTTHQTTNRARAYIAGLISYGQVPLKVLYKADDSSHGQLWTDFKAGTVLHWKVEVPFSPVENWTFEGYVKSFETSTPIDNRIEADIQITVTDDVSKA